MTQSQLPAGAGNLQTPALTLSGLDLLMDAPDPDYGWRIHALAENFELGDPEAVITAIVSQLEDGDTEDIDDFGNREATIPLRLDAPASLSPGHALARAAAALDAACRFTGHTEMIYTPPLAAGAPSVFEVTSAVVSTPYNDLIEIQHGQRHVTLTIHARPFVRTIEPVHIEAPAIGAALAPEVIDDGTTANGWSATDTTNRDPIRNLITNPIPADVNGWITGSNGYDIYYSSGALICRGTQDDLETRAQWGTQLTVAAGRAYRVGLDIHLLQGTGSAGVVLAWMNTAGNRIGAEQRLTVAATTAWRTCAWTVTAPSGAVRVAFRPFGDVANGRSWRSTIFLRRALFADVTALPAGDRGNVTYFDGTTPDTGTFDYAWEGTASRSVSRRTPQPTTLGVADGMVRGIGRHTSAISLRRSGSIATGTQRPWITVRGRAVRGSGPTPALLPTLADGNGRAISASSRTYNPTTGDFELIAHRTSAISDLTVRVRTDAAGTYQVADMLSLSISRVEITSSPFPSSVLQMRTIDIAGSQRTDLSLSVEGYDTTGKRVGLGDQVLVYTAPAALGPTFVACRKSSASNVGIPEAGTISGEYSNGGAMFAVALAAFAPGTYTVLARLRPTSAGTKDVRYSSNLRVGSQDYSVAGDPVGSDGTVYKHATLVAVAASATPVWPQLKVGAWSIVPVGMLRIPPGDIDPETNTHYRATVRINVYSDDGIQLDEVLLCHTGGDLSLADCSYSNVPGKAAGSFAAIRLDAPTVEHPFLAARMGRLPGTGGPTTDPLWDPAALWSDPARWMEASIHHAVPGPLLVATLTPGCDTSLVSGDYHPRYHTYTVTDLPEPDPSEPDPGPPPEPVVEPVNPNPFFDDGTPDPDYSFRLTGWNMMGGNFSWADGRVRVVQNGAGGGTNGPAQFPLIPNPTGQLWRLRTTFEVEQVPEGWNGNNVGAIWLSLILGHNPEGSGSSASSGKWFDVTTGGPHFTIEHVSSSNLPGGPYEYAGISLGWRGAGIIIVDSLELIPVETP